MTRIDEFHDDTNAWREFSIPKTDFIRKSEREVQYFFFSEDILPPRSTPSAPNPHATGLN